MRKLLRIFVLLLIAGSFAGCAWLKNQPDVNELIARVKKKNDPGDKAKNITTAIFKYACLNDNEKSRVTILLKRPGKIKIISRAGNEFWECAFDGKRAWEYSNTKGLRFLKEAKSNEIRLQAFLLSPSIDIKKVFKDIKIDSSVKVDGQDCWKLLCQPADTFKSQAITVFVTKKTNLIVKAIEEQDEDEDGDVVKVVTAFKDYKMFHGFLLPVKTITEVEGDVTESTLTDIILDEEIPDSVFSAPDVFK
jgi:outer membrane lipoprotein-sorting protein